VKIQHLFFLAYIRLFRRFVIWWIEYKRSTIKINLNLYLKLLICSSIVDIYLYIFIWQLFFFEFVWLIWFFSFLGEFWFAVAQYLRTYVYIQYILVHMYVPYSRKLHIVWIRWKLQQKNQEKFSHQDFHVSSLFIFTKSENLYKIGILFAKFCYTFSFLSKNFRGTKNVRENGNYLRIFSQKLNICGFAKKLDCSKLSQAKI